MAMVGAAYSDGDQMSIMSEKIRIYGNNQDRDVLLLGFAFDTLVAGTSGSGSRPSASLSSGLCKRLIVFSGRKIRILPAGCVSLAFLGLSDTWTVEEVLLRGTFWVSFQTKNPISIDQTWNAKFSSLYGKWTHTGIFVCVILGLSTTSWNKRE
jgi:hypothetical protein